eukprot:767010-Hanusia_phi.AAC.1
MLNAKCSDSDGRVSHRRRLWACPVRAGPRPGSRHGGPMPPGRTRLRLVRLTDPGLSVPDSPCPAPAAPTTVCSRTALSARSNSTQLM